LKGGRTLAALLNLVGLLTVVGVSRPEHAIIKHERAVGRGEKSESPNPASYTPAS
jgi:hypothetical protein